MTKIYIRPHTLLVRKLKNRKLLAQINASYADGPSEEERAEHRALWEMQRRQLLKEKQ